MTDTTTPAPEAIRTFEDDYSWWEVVYWLVGIIMIPLVPILMIAFLTPFSGVGATGH